MVRNLPANAGDMGLSPGWGIKIPNAVWHDQEKTKKGGYGAEKWAETKRDTGGANLEGPLVNSHSSC